MKKEKKVRTYQRRTKSGKTVTVRAHTASYEAAEKAKEAAKKRGAGDELSSKVKKGEEWKLPMDEFLKKLKEERVQKRDEESKKVEDEKPKKSEKKTEKKTPAKKTTKKRTVGTGTNGPEPKKKATAKKTATKADTSEPAFTSAEFKEWYRGTGSDADKKVAKALRKQLGRSGYRKFEDEAIDNYTSRGHLSMFKRVSGGSSVGGVKATQNGKVPTSANLTSVKVPKGYTIQGKPRSFKDDEGKGHKVSAINKDGYKVTLYRYDDATAKKLGENNKQWSLEFGSEIPIKSKVKKAKPEKKPVKGSLGITKSEFKEWYSDTDGSSPSFKKVNKALKKFYGKTWDEVENRAVFGGKTQYQDMLKEIGSRFSTSPTTEKAVKKRSVGTGIEEKSSPRMPRKRNVVTQSQIDKFIKENKGFKKHKDGTYTYTYHTRTGTKVDKVSRNEMEDEVIADMKMKKIRK